MRRGFGLVPCDVSRSPYLKQVKITMRNRSRAQRGNNLSRNLIDHTLDIGTNLVCVCGGGGVKHMYMPY